MNKLACCLFLFASALAAGRAGDQPSDLDRLQGTWVVVSLIEKGKAVAAEEAATIEIVIDKDTYTAFEKGKIVVKYQFKLDPTKTPRQVDFTYLVGDDKGKTEPGIYVIEKDQVRFCLDEDKKGRPTKFEGDSFSVLTLKKKPS
ncbi:MAG: TIGR03067 domain-containing protein [Planctomycetes bacterium]|nr:TIGR03067 domain-containing protein [Planctomycetota bacterium]